MNYSDPTLAAVEAHRGAPPVNPDDPLSGAWRGTLRSGPDTQTPLVISVVKKADAYDGMMNVGGTAETPIRKIALTGNRVVVDNTADSKLGEVAPTTDPVLDGNKLTGGMVERRADSTELGSVASRQSPLAITLLSRFRRHPSTPTGVPTNCGA